MTIDLTQIILAVITLIGALITRFLIPWLIENVEEKKRAKIVDIVCTLVETADRYLQTGSGEERLRYVVDGLADKGIYVNMQDIHDQYRVLIESAVEQLRIRQGVQG
jgi:hypothetical protein